MKILHLCDGMPPATLGGAGGIMCELATEQARRGHDVHLLTATDGMDGPWTAHRIGPKGMRFAHYRSVFSGRRAEEVLSVVRRVSADAIHLHAAAFQIGYRWLPSARALGIPATVTFHDAMHVRYGKVVGDETLPALRELRRFRWSYNPLRHAMIRGFLRSAGALVAVSDALRTYLERYGLGPMQTVRNGIDLEAWSPSPRAEARATLGLPADKTVFLIAGRLGGEKGLATALAALPSGSILAIAGDGSAPDDPARFRAFPRQDAAGMRSLYAACNAVLVPSTYLDPFPTVCLEAMAMARPILATTLGGATEAVVDGATGWAIDPFDIGAWKDRMKWCASHCNVLDDVGRAGRSRAESAFSIGRMADDMERVYSSAKGKGMV